MIKEAAGLIQQIEQVNDALLAEHRARVLPEVEKQLAKVQVELDDAKADGDLRNRCLYPLQQLKSQVETQTSIAHIGQAATTAVDLADAAFAEIEAALKPKSRPPGAVKEKLPMSYVKPRRVIKAAALTPKPYLETQDDIDAYLNKLRDALEQIIAAGDRIEIR